MRFRCAVEKTVRFSPGLAASGAGDEVSVSVKNKGELNKNQWRYINVFFTSILNQYGHII